MIVDVDRSSAMDFSETIEVKVIDQEERQSGNSYDSYFFAYFHNISAALDQIRDAVKTYKPFPLVSGGVTEIVHDTTLAAASGDRASSLPSEQSNRSGYGLKLGSLLRPFQFDSTSSVPTPTQSNVQSRSSEPSGSFRHAGALVSSPPTLSTQPLQPNASDQNLPIGSGEGSKPLSEGNVGAVSAIKNAEFIHTYPPPPSPPSELVPIVSRDSSSSLSSWGVPSWLRTSRRILSSPYAASSTSTIRQEGVSEIVSSSPTRSGNQSSPDLGFSILETRNAAEPEVVEKFRSTFAFDEKEQLLGCTFDQIDFLCIH